MPSRSCGRPRSSGCSWMASWWSCVLEAVVGAGAGTRDWYPELVRNTYDATRPSTGLVVPEVVRLATDQYQQDNAPLHQNWLGLRPKDVTEQVAWHLQVPWGMSDCHKRSIPGLAVFSFEACFGSSRQKNAP
jgi:hypothetical protein